MAMSKDRVLFRLPNYLDGATPSTRPLWNSQARLARHKKAQASVEALILAATEALGITRQQAEKARQNNLPILARPSQFARFVILRQGHAERLGGGNFMLQGLKARIVSPAERLFERDPLDLSPDPLVSDVDTEQPLYAVTIPPLLDPHAYYLARRLSKWHQVSHNTVSEAIRDGKSFVMTAQQLATLLSVNSDALLHPIDGAGKVRVRSVERVVRPAVLDVSGHAAMAASDKPNLEVCSGVHVQVSMDMDSGRVEVRHADPLQRLDVLKNHFPDVRDYYLIRDALVAAAKKGTL